MTKILEIDDCSECKYCGGGTMVVAYCCHNDRQEDGEFENYPDIPSWCPLSTEPEIKPLRDAYAEITKDLNDAIILHNKIEPNGNVMIKGGFIAELQKKYAISLRTLVIPKAKETK